MAERAMKAPGSVSRARDEDGSAGVETAMAVSALLLMMFFVIGAMRLTGTEGDVASAARAGARAAATARTSAQADADATAVVVNALGGTGVACAGGPDVDVDGAGVPGNTVTVIVTCVVDLDDVVLAGFPGSRSVEARAVEFVDTIRGER